MSLSQMEALMGFTRRDQGRWPVEAMDQLAQHECLVLGSGWEPIARFRAGGQYAE
jgi:hypothetical protein